MTELDKNQVAEFLGVTPRTIHRYIKEGLPYSRNISGYLRFDQEEVKKWVQDRVEKNNAGN